MSDVVVRDNTAAHRYEAVVDEDVVGFADYTLDQGVPRTTTSSPHPAADLLPGPGTT